MTYKVLVHNTVVKEYPTELQALIYCFMNGYVNTGHGWYFLDDRVKIVGKNKHEMDNDKL